MVVGFVIASLLPALDRSDRRLHFPVVRACRLGVHGLFSLCAKRSRERSTALQQPAFDRLYACSQLRDCSMTLCQHLVFKLGDMPAAPLQLEQQEQNTVQPILDLTRSCLDKYMLVAVKRYDLSLNIHKAKITESQVLRRKRQAQKCHVSCCQPSSQVAPPGCHDDPGQSL